MESNGIAKWIYATLAADSAISALIGTRIYEGPAPQTTAYPFIRYDQQSTLDVRGATEATRIMVNELWLIRAVAETESYQGNLATLADRIDALFQNTNGSATGAVVFNSAREFAMRMPEDEQGISYRHLGGIYRIYAQGT